MMAKESYDGPKSTLFDLLFHPLIAIIQENELLYFMINKLFHLPLHIIDVWGHM